MGEIKVLTETLISTAPQLGVCFCLLGFFLLLNSAVGQDHYLTDFPTPLSFFFWVRLGVPQLVIGFFVGAEIETIFCLKSL